MLFFSLFWSIDILLGKWIYMQGIDPFQWIVHVYFFASIFWLIYMIRMDAFQPTHLIKQLKYPFLIVATTAAIWTSLSYVGLNFTQAINYSFLVQSSMLFTVIFAHVRFTDEKITRIKSWLMVVFLLGIYLVSTGWTLLIPQWWDLFVVAGAVFFAINNITIKHCIRWWLQVPTIILWRNIATVLIWICMSLLILWKIVSLWDMLPYAMISAFLLCVWIFSLNKVVEYSSPSYMSMMATVNPVLVVIWASIFLGESMSVIQLLGWAIVLSSWVVLEYIRRKN